MGCLAHDPVTWRTVAGQGRGLGACVWRGGGGEEGGVGDGGRGFGFD